MYSPSWLSDQSLMDSLLQEPWRCQAAQALRLLGHDNAGQVQFISEPSCSYPCGELNHMKPTDSGWQLVSTQPALTGFYGALPYVYQDMEAQQRLTLDDDSILGFFSLFNDRILQHTNQIQLRPVMSVHYEQNIHQPLTQGHRLLAVSGIPWPKHIPVDNLARYAAVLARKTTNLELLGTLLKDYFALDFQLQPPPVVKMPFARECRTQLHSRVNHRTPCAGRLGENTLLGSSCYLLHSSVSVVISVNTVREYQAIISDARLAPAIVEMCVFFFASIVRFRLQINCPRHCLVSPRLSSRPGTNVARLGRLSCLLPELHPEQRVTVDFPGRRRNKRFSRRESRRKSGNEPQ
ncbi:type VI secretion system baseplate subunit TssG [Endozoicomonas sp.]|uniref:type VI secretion system baseplate subunit TssG n=1 Tax=Endozoicomonas sp. TaxID=1892382 RepID=UPI00288858BD|nr:type VI secretion system baseplate subunit TssG [Endozoicomonas sp.]